MAVLQARGSRRIFTKFEELDMMYSVFVRFAFVIKII